MTFLEWLENTLRQIIELTKASANPATHPVAASVIFIIGIAGVVITPLIVTLIAVRITKKAKKAHLQRQNTLNEFKSNANKLDLSMSPEDMIKVMGEGYSKCFGTIDYVDSKKGDVYHRNVTIYRWNCGKYNVKAIFNHKNNLQELKTNFIKDDICQMTNEEMVREVYED